MKKESLLVLLLLSITFVTKAQLVTLGLKMGANYANFKSTTLQTKALTSYHAGLIAQIKVLEGFSLQPELLYSTQGATYDYAFQEFKSELGYVSLPLMAKIDLGKTLSLELGSQFSWLASKKVNWQTDVKTLDFSANAGLGVKLTDRLFIQGRYVLGLTEIGKNVDIKNSVGQLSLGVLF
ncbi:PorT family protein [Flavobacterium columnare]|uniref:porin family protein n=1 Tax=Flavobacterium columnare TaxID=996 RepID=UPI000D1A0945|nr:porin family protein [Flavobacterium columnare]MBF6652259.1 PorT family protein [Flavobacterium columnare]MBF6654648.1 PorT family protein [Flavobacterium columnare]MBF6657152.1 PorT family protein [Flavobacterium columnare]PTD16431.1 PorT family protein [Flavobacterium columnare]